MGRENEETRLRLEQHVTGINTQNRHLVLPFLIRHLLLPRSFPFFISLVSFFFLHFHPIVFSILGIISSISSSLYFVSTRMHIRTFCNLYFSVSMLLSMNIVCYFFFFFGVVKLLQLANLSGLVCYILFAFIFFSCIFFTT